MAGMRANEETVASKAHLYASASGLAPKCLCFPSLTGGALRTVNVLHHGAADGAGAWGEAAEGAMRPAFRRIAGSLRRVLLEPCFQYYMLNKFNT